MWKGTSFALVTDAEMYILTSERLEEKKLNKPAVCSLRQIFP